MKLSAKSEYACLALIELTRHYDKGVLTITEIARRKSIPKKFLEQILLQLKRGGFVKSRKGVGGGYFLAKKPSEISLAEVIRLMDGALAPVESVSTYFYEKTPIEQCPRLLAIFKDIRDYIARKMESTTLEKLKE